MSRHYSGFLDPIDGVLVRGWALNDDAATESALVDVFIDTKFVMRLRANTYRADLDTRGYNDGFAAFGFEIPVEFRDGEIHVLDARHAETDISLGDAPITFSLDGRGRAALAEKRRWSARNLVFEAAPLARLDDSLRVTRKLAILSTYHEAETHLAYHRALLTGLREAGFTVLVVHAANSHRPGIADTGIPNCFTILKRNIGYDFGSYAVGVFAVADFLPLIDELVLMNDSVVQIAGGLPRLIERMRDAGPDAVSCTDSFEHHYHLQSYMVWFGREICASGCLQRFMSDYSFTSVKEDVIAEGEIGLSRRLQAEGYTIGALFAYQAVASAWVRAYAETSRRIRDLPGLPPEWSGPCYKKGLLERLDLVTSLAMSGTPLNPSHFFWDILIEAFDFPFIKRELLIKNPCHVPTYFKIGTHIPAGSATLAAVMEIRHLYGGQLVPLSVPPACAAPPVRPQTRDGVRSPARDRGRTASNEDGGKGLQPPFKVSPRPGIRGPQPLMGPVWF